ncbi:MAG: hypothetical protein QME81_11580 [bacterium]|nr:hypothetical protein [bacterium]
MQPANLWIMLVFFSLEGAKQEMGVVEIVESCLETAGKQHQAAQLETFLGVAHTEPKTKKQEMGLVETVEICLETAGKQHEEAQPKTFVEVVHSEPETKKQERGVVETVKNCLETAGIKHQEVQPETSLRVVSSDPETKKQEIGVMETVKNCLETAGIKHQEVQPETSLRVVSSEPETKKQEIGVVETVKNCLKTAGSKHQEIQPKTSLRVVSSEPETNWHKLDHLLYLPILGLTRPRDLYYYQGKGLKMLYGFTYKYLTLEHFLGQLTRLQVGYSLADALAKDYSQAWYPGDAPLFIFSDWHVKPHWTKHPSHSGHVTMWERVMPGTKQLVINGPDGHLLGGWNYQVDTHLTHVLVDLEADLATKLQRPIAYNIFDSEGNGLPTAQRYTEAERDYISVLPRNGKRNYSATRY